MAQESDLEALRKEFVVKANAAFDQMFGQDGQNGLVTFTEREVATATRRGGIEFAGANEGSFAQASP